MQKKSSLVVELDHKTHECSVKADGDGMDSLVMLVAAIDAVATATDAEFEVVFGALGMFYHDVYRKKRFAKINMGAIEQARERGGNAEGAEP